jgi:tetratricopeptide (TPR) repeat protein
VNNSHITAAKPATVKATAGAGLARLTRRDTLLLALGLAALSVVAFYPALDNGFVILDDEEYVVHNPSVLAGLSGDGLKFAFTTFRTGNWHPLTWLSLEADASLFGTGPAGFHRTNVVLHAANGVLLFLALLWLTGKQWPSVVVAALFAVHPLRAESVAWVAERKDVLSTFFGLFALLAYAAYAAAPSLPRYLAVAVLFALSLLAKPMWVTFPCLLLLLDWWPLGRVRFGAVGGNPTSWRARAWPLLEKLPLFVLAGVSCVTTWLAQRGAAASSLELVPFGARVANAIVSYGEYLFQTVWPVGLAPFYPLRAQSPVATSLSALLLVAVSAAAWFQRRVRPYLAVGWLWYLGTLVPVIGLVQVGGQARADRYTYLPLIGIYLMVVWGLDELAVRRNTRGTALAAAGVVVATLTMLCQYQAGLWHDDLRLWKHTIALTGPNWMAQLCLGLSEERANNPDAAFGHFAESAELAPNQPKPQFKYALGLNARGRRDEARQYLLEAIKRLPRSALLRTALGITYHSEGNLDKARRCYEEAIELDPNVPSARANLGAILRSRGDLREALEQLQIAAALEPDNAPAFFNLGAVLEDLGRPNEAAAAYRRSVELDPGLKPRLDPSLGKRRKQAPPRPG